MINIYPQCLVGTVDKFKEVIILYIAPNSTIYILRNVRIDNTYANTIHFNSSTEQAAYFQGLRKYALSNYTYIRKENAIRVEIRADNLYDCNYIMFQNSSFGMKWFYGFITNVEYINNETSAIYYEIDVMQTWYFDYAVNPSFIEREHSTSDNPGDNLVPDNLELGEYVSDDFDGTGHMGQYSYIVAATFDGDLADAVGTEYGGIYSGLKYNSFTDISELNDFIESATSSGKSDGIVSIFAMPRDFVKTTESGVTNYTITKTKSVTQIGNYTPKNKKLLTYPYNFLYVTNLSGMSAVFPYEFFSSDDCQFSLNGDMSCNPQIFLTPLNYKGVAANYNEKLSMDGFPQCAFTTDSFKAWLAQSGASASLTMVGGAVAASLATGPVGIIAGLGAVAGSVAQIYEHAIQPPQSRGSQSNSAAVAARIKDFAFMHTHIREEFARIIDDYWDMYGYPSHRVKLPNISTRPHWNYVKTVNISITGSIPTDDMSKIKNVYNNGVTFWRNGNEVGNYSLDNSIGVNSLNGGEASG